jgi:hypothetical protein
MDIIQILKIEYKFSAKTPLIYSGSGSGSPTLVQILLSCFHLDTVSQ